MCGGGDDDDDDDDDGMCCWEACQLHAFLFSIFIFDMFLNWFCTFCAPIRVAATKE